MGMTRQILSDEMWEELSSALEQVKDRRGAPSRLSEREFLEAVGGELNNLYGPVEAGIEVTRGRGPVVLRSLDRSEQGRRTAGEHSLHQGRIAAEGGRALGGVEDPQAAARPGAGWPAKYPWRSCSGCLRNTGVTAPLLPCNSGSP